MNMSYNDDKEVLDGKRVLEILVIKKQWKKQKIGYKKYHKHTTIMNCYYEVLNVRKFIFHI